MTGVSANAQITGKGSRKPSSLLGREEKESACLYIPAHNKTGVSHI